MVSWQVRGADTDRLAVMFGEELATTVDAAEEHHGDDLPDSVTGEILSIQAVHCRFAAEPGDPVRTLVERSGTLTPVVSADGWSRDTDAMRFEDWPHLRAARA